ncbi:DUF72 domain-containing protein [Luteococcus sp.]|uniref:DUF72 domain-containing protein n=1 Tax=Luteococcus sp. TaxID=1969402 RepID=UPI003736F767
MDATPHPWIGTSGWNYDDWSPEVYPPGLPKVRRRDVYATHFDTVELNASFYRWPRETSFQLWHDALPDGFRMTVKAPKALTHTGRLRTVDEWSERLATDWARLGERAGLFLVQLAPSHVAELDVLDSFLTALPPSMRVAMELRHPSWQTEEMLEVLRAHSAAYVVMHGPKLPSNLWATADFCYLRFHGPDPARMYVGEYGDRAMQRWAEPCRRWMAEGREVWAYFNNDYQANGVRDARRLRSLLGGHAPGDGGIGDQPTAGTVDSSTSPSSQQS